MFFVAQFILALTLQAILKHDARKLCKSNKVYFKLDLHGS